ncbi:MAG: hypothetical protein WB646_20280 [Steroidobacteraceae bacterium]
MRRELPHGFGNHCHTLVTDWTGGGILGKKPAAVKKPTTRFVSAFAD